MTLLEALAAAGASTIAPWSRNSGWLEFIERGSVTWDDDLAFGQTTILDWNLHLAEHRR